MANVTNCTPIPLTLPVTGQVIRPGATIRADRWNIVKGAEVVRAWLQSKALTVEEGVEDAVALAPVTPESVDIDIPTGWRDLAWNDRRALAARFSAEPIRNGEEADAVIAAELARREG
jgi:hypothetical protein